jgi:hypothetical protein
MKMVCSRSLQMVRRRIEMVCRRKMVPDSSGARIMDSWDTKRLALNVVSMLQGKGENLVIYISLYRFFIWLCQ